MLRSRRSHITALRRPPSDPASLSRVLWFNGLGVPIEEATMAVQGMEHFTVLAEDLEATRKFYGDILGLEDGYRPPLGFPGAWLYVGGRAVLHVIAGRALPKERAGVLDHMAFAAKDLP